MVGESGPPHAKVYEIKCSLTDASGTDLEQYTANGSSIVKAKQAVAEIAWAQTKLEKPSPSAIQNNQQRRPQQQQQYQNNNWNRNNNFNNNRGGGQGLKILKIYLLLFVG